VLDQLGAALEKAGFWSEFNSDWFCLDCEVMPWSVKAEDLLRTQYAPTGAAATTALSAAQALVAKVAARGLDVEELGNSLRERMGAAQQYVEAYRRYCWPVNGIEDIRVAPFHLLASEGTVHVDKDHIWHMSTLHRLCDSAPGLLKATPFQTARLADDAETRVVIHWWEQLTGDGGEGMVVKPLVFAHVGKRGLIQPAIKSRGPEYLRIIYGPEYTRPEYLSRLRERNLAGKRSLAIREFALGIEGLERFVRREPLRRVHECVFGVLAMESEPVDPRL